jgi:perosamine synthetase
MKKIYQMEPWVGVEEQREVLKVLKSGWLTEAGKTRDFEKSLASFVGSRYAVAVSNGTVSLFAALSSLGVGPSDEVIVPDFTMIASPNAILLTGASPIFVDIEKETLCLDLTDVEKKITKKTKAIMPVPINGRAPDMVKLTAIAKKYKLFIVEDAAQALGSYYRGKHLGTFGEVGSFSFSTPKVITTGQGGALVTNNKRLYEKMIRIKDFGRRKRGTDDYEEVGYNFKFTDLQAALGIAQMRKLKWRLKKKKQMYYLYRKLLQDIPEIKFIETNLGDVSPWFIDIIVPDPVILNKYLKIKGIETRRFYPAIHTTKFYQQTGRFPNSLWAAKHGLWLPSSTFLKNEDIKRICREIRGFYKK